MRTMIPLNISTRDRVNKQCTLEANEPALLSLVTMYRHRNHRPVVRVQQVL